MSVPVRTIAHPMPRAMGSFAAVREIMMIMEERERNSGTLMAIKIMASIINYVLLIK